MNRPQSKCRLGRVHAASKRGAVGGGEKWNWPIFGADRERSAGWLAKIGQEQARLCQSGPNTYAPVGLSTREGRPWWNIRLTLFEHGKPFYWVLPIRRRPSLNAGGPPREKIATTSLASSETLRQTRIGSESSSRKQSANSPASPFRSALRSWLSTFFLYRPL